VDHLEEDLLTIVQMIWATLLDLEIYPTQIQPPKAGDECTLAGCVQITGGWEGAIVLHCSEDFAGWVASIMYEMAEETVTSEQIQDTLGELANMIAGNIKPLLGEACYLSLPTVVEGSDYTLRIPKSRVVHELTFACQEHCIVLSVLQGEPIPPTSVCS
jgi:chemotaxis protein CheX